MLFSLYKNTFYKLINMLFINLLKLIKSFNYAFKGIGQAMSSQQNFRVHVLAVLVVCIAGWYVQLHTWEWLALVLCFGMVLAIELINTAIEYLTDLVEPNFNPLAGKVKDAAAGAVLIAAITSVVVAIIIFGKYIIA